MIEILLKRRKFPVKLKSCSSKVKLESEEINISLIIKAQKLYTNLHTYKSDQVKNSSR